MLFECRGPGYSLGSECLKYLVKQPLKNTGIACQLILVYGLGGGVAKDDTVQFA